LTLKSQETWGKVAKKLLQDMISRTVSLVTERHQGRVINLEYNPLQKMAIGKTVMLVGKVRNRSHNKSIAYKTRG
jgi:hypothetical protein